MSGSQYTEPPLDTSLIYRGPQTPATQAYVPLPVFVVELLVLLGLFALMKWWVVAVLPLHVLPVMKTNSDPFWVRDLWADINQRWLVSNKGQYGKGVVTFSVKPPSRRRK